MPKISALPPAGSLADDDETPFVDDSVGQTKKFTLSGLLSWLRDGKLPTLRNVYYYSANDTYTKPSSMKDNGFVVVEAIGGGGGGGGAAATASQTRCASGGGSGGYSRSKIPAASLDSSVAVTVGTGGSGATAGDNAGGNGGNSSFGDHVIANGGSGGGARGITTQGGNGGAVGTGDIAIAGRKGFNGPFNGSSVLFAVFGGAGADSVLGGGGRNQTTITVSAGGAASGPGGGGGGGCTYDNNGNAAGGAGAAGIVIVKEYY